MALFLFVFYLQRNVFSFSVFVFVDNVEYLRSNPTWGEEAAGWRLRKLGTNNSLNLWRRNRLNLEILVWAISIGCLLSSVAGYPWDISLADRRPGLDKLRLRSYDVESRARILWADERLRALVLAKYNKFVSLYRYMCTSILNLYIKLHENFPEDLYIKQCKMPCHWKSCQIRL